MRIPASVVGISVGPREQEIDARWLMAYAAALGEHAPEYLDTARPDGVIAHPLFPVCYEWPLALDVRAKALPDEIAVRGVHATHDLTVHRAPRPGDRLSTTATVRALERRAPGACMVLRMETVDAAGRPVTTTDYGSLYLGVDCDGDASPGTERARAASQERPHRSLSPQERGQGEGWWSTEVPVPATLAHVYTECARIWNPIHTDRAVALAAGLPDIILHGTATLALGVSQVLHHEQAGSALTVRGLSCRFGAMVRLPSRILVRGRDDGSSDGRLATFEVLTEDGRPAVRDGRVRLGDRRSDSR
ncbi:MAG TPA: MaoC/PaaZ C-terminal domain-containing protein [Methylomirabilota bacterium]|nr:MaoC/PaaZ C-terminal domain-containing protein [Methylomirabilota bacterium]